MCSAQQLREFDGKTPKSTTKEGLEDSEESIYAIEGCSRMGRQSKSR